MAFGGSPTRQATPASSALTSDLGLPCGVTAPESIPILGSAQTQPATESVSRARAAAERASMARRVLTAASAFWPSTPGRTGPGGKRAGRLFVLWKRHDCRGPDIE